MKIGKARFDYSSVFEAIKENQRIIVDSSVIKSIEKQRKAIIELVKKGKIMYGINTGFGALKNKNISIEELGILQENLIVSHAVGVGDPIDSQIVRIIMFLIANYLSKGFSGVRPIIITTLLEMINKNVIPVVPQKGSVGSSGDLAPSAHIILTMIGKGQACYKNKIAPSGIVMKQAGISVVKLEAKEGLALINNTATMTGHAVAALVKADYLSDIADIAAALSAEALRATPNAFDPRIHAIKPHKGQILVAKAMRDLLSGTTMVDKERIQDQYSIRCVPQVHGAVRLAIDFAASVVNTEINSVTDNPLVFSFNNKVDIISGGNFHGEAVAIAVDSLRLAVCELANISDRRIASLLDYNHNFGLPAFLAKNPGLNSGMMILQYTTAALVSENKILAHPAVVDSIPTSANVEDIVSMGTIGSRKALEVLENVEDVLAIEMLVACQAINFRLLQGFALGKKTNQIYKQIRKNVPFFENDTEYMPYVLTIKEMIQKKAF